ncbi:MAG: NAD(P)H-binding protein [Myxococcales bacterium]|nr:NAD(P)H-binding protein [Myxococcales bacterium]
MSAAFVFGATGHVGRRIVEQLAASKTEVLAHIRPDSPRLMEWVQRFRDTGALPDSTPFELAALAKRFELVRPQVVFCTIGTTRTRMKLAAERGENEEHQSYEEVDFGLTKLLVDALIQADHKARFVYLSSAGTSEGAFGAYLQTRWRAEQVIKNSGLPYTLARASIIRGPDRDDKRPLEELGATASDFLLQVAALVGGKTIRNRYRSHDPGELAKAMIRIGYDPECENKVIEADELRGSAEKDK